MKDKNSKTCEGCEGMCCKYVSMEIDVPESLEDFENVKWYVCHKNVNVYVDLDDGWYVEFLTPCEFLGEDGWCQNYENRPQICREYSQETCPFHNKYEEKYTFRELKDVEEYIGGVFKKGRHVVPDED